MFAYGAREKKRRVLITVAGGGPAGLAIATACAREGFSVRVVTPRPGDPWPNSYGCFQAVTGGLKLEEAILTLYSNPRIVTETSARGLNAAYLRLESHRLKELMTRRAQESGVAILDGQIEAPFQDERELLVDATGAMSRLWRGVAPTPLGYQSAYGMWLKVDPVSASLMPGMTLMDYRGPLAEKCPSFLYSMRETESRLFVQETVLIHHKRVSMDLLRERLFLRLGRMGVPTDQILGEERCVIPMGVAVPKALPLSGTLPFGAAAGLVHPATGYQLTRSLRLAEDLARELSRVESESGTAQSLAEAGFACLWPDERRRAFDMYGLGAGVLMDLDRAAMQRFVRAFFALEQETWLNFMEGELGAQEILKAMWRIFRNAPGGLRFKLLSRGSVRGCRALTHTLVQRQSNFQDPARSL